MVINMDYTQLIIEMYKNGIGINKISKILKIRTVELYKILRDENFLRDNVNQRDDEICFLYNNGTKITDIANSLNINRHTVTDILKKRDIYKHDATRDDIDTEEKRERNDSIITLYQSGFSMRKVAQQLGICAGTVKNVLDYYGVKKRAQHQTGHSKGTTKNRKHIFDFNYFKVIDTEEKAYWLGFLYADGCVHDRGLISIALQERDKDHLLLLKQCLGANTVELSYSPKTKSYSLSICSVNMANDLINLGCIPNKSLTLEFPTEERLPKYLLHHFMRGYFDGDGCIYSPSDKSKGIFSVLGTHNFLNSYEKYLLDGIGRKSPTKRQHKDSWNKNTDQIAYGGRQQINKISHFLYKDATIYLKRKRNKFNLLLPSWDETDSNPKITRVELSEDHAKSKDSVFEFEGACKS